MIQRIGLGVRRTGMRVFSRVNPGDITVKHSWSGDPILMHSFRHKGYWYHRGSREREAMVMAARLLSPGDHVVEVGGHIGYLTVFFSRMVGDCGKVDVFEPAPSNLRYLVENTRALNNVVVHVEALSDNRGQADFFVDDLTGQNSSLLKDYDALRANVAHSGVETRVECVSVATNTLSEWSTSTGRGIDFIKIDVEGARTPSDSGGARGLAGESPHHHD